MLYLLWTKLLYMLPDYPIEVFSFVSIASIQYSSVYTIPKHFSEYL
jgi:hypothetical protein